MCTASTATHFITLSTNRSAQCVYAIQFLNPIHSPPLIFILTLPIHLLKVNLIVAILSCLFYEKHTHYFVIHCTVLFILYRPIVPLTETSSPRPQLVSAIDVPPIACTSIARDGSVPHWQLTICSLRPHSFHLGLLVKITTVHETAQMCS